MQAGSSPAPTRSEHSVHLWTFFVSGVELRNVEWTPRDAVLASDAVVLLEVDDPVGVLDDRSVRGAGFQTAGIGAMQAPSLRISQLNVPSSAVCSLKRIRL